MNSLEWSSHTPTAAGWYWWRSPEHGAQIVRLYHNPEDDCLMIRSPSGDYDMKASAAPTVSLEWAGPIPLPCSEPKEVAS